MGKNARSFSTRIPTREVGPKDAQRIGGGKQYFRGKGRKGHGRQFEQEFKSSMDMFVDWCNSLNIDHGVKKVHRIIDTTSVRGFPPCGHCGENEPFCGVCNSSLIGKIIAPRAPADYEIFHDQGVVLVENKSVASKEAKSFLLSAVKPHQMEMLKNLDGGLHCQGWLAVNDRRVGGSKKGGGYRCWHVFGTTGIKFLQEVSRTIAVKGQKLDFTKAKLIRAQRKAGRSVAVLAGDYKVSVGQIYAVINNKAWVQEPDENFIRWEAFDAAAKRRPELVSNIPRTFGSLWDLSHWSLWTGWVVSNYECDCPHASHPIPHLTKDFIRKWKARSQTEVLDDPAEGFMDDSTEDKSDWLLTEV